MSKIESLARTLLALTIFASLPISLGLSQQKTTSWEGFQKIEFEVAGRNAFVIVPNQAAPGNPWIWRTEFFGHEPQADLALIERGWHAAYINIQNLYGAPAALDAMDSFYDHMTQTRHLASRVVLEGFSRGGLYSLNYAVRRPERIACLYNDAPVCDSKSWPGGKGKGKGSPNDWKRCLDAYRLSEQEALAFDRNPVDQAAKLASHRIPILHICGDADEVVPYDENTQLFAERYRAAGGPIEVIVKPGVAHHPHSLKDPAPIVDFILKHAPKAP